MTFLLESRVYGVEPSDLRSKIALKSRNVKQGACVFITEAEPIEFMSAFLAAEPLAAEIFLCDPKWGTSEWSQVMSLATPDVVLGEAPAYVHSSAELSRHPLQNSDRFIMIATGGTSGRIKFARHTLATFSAAVAGFKEHFGVERINALGVLPLYHISGFMGWLRTVLSEGIYFPWSSKALEYDDVPKLPSQDDGWFCSLVPTQLQRLTQSPVAVAWLKTVRTIFVGGGPAWSELLENAAQQGLLLSVSYGMTETGAMIAALKPAEFLSGARNVGQPMPHAQVHLDDGRIVIRSRSLFKGYYPERHDIEEFVTEDLGKFDAQGRLEVLGRIDDVIITGGKKVSPLEVEAALRSSCLLSDVCVIGLADPERGPVVIAFYPVGSGPLELEQLKHGLKS